MFSEFKHKDVVWNNLSAQTRALLEELVPADKNKVMYFKRNSSPLKIKAYKYDDMADDATNRGADYVQEERIGSRMLCSETTITDPFSKEFVKVINMKSRDTYGDPVPSISYFEKNNWVLAIRLDSILARQTAAMFFLLPECANNILDEGKPVACDRYDFELWSGESVVSQRNQTDLSHAELIVAVNQLPFDKLKLLATYTGFPDVDSQAGPGFMIAWIKGQIETRIGVVQSGFAQLDILEAVELLRYNELHNIIYKDDASGYIRWNTDQQVAFFAYDRNSADQFRSCAEILVTPKGAETLMRLKRAGELVGQRQEAEISKNIDELLSIPEDSGKDPAAVARGKALAEKARLAREAKKEAQPVEA